MNEVLKIDIDRNWVEEIINRKVDERIQEIVNEKVFWTMEELCTYVNLSIPSVKNSFFYDEDFPKFRHGSKWLIPAQSAKAYLNEWWKGQQKH